MFDTHCHLNFKALRKHLPDVLAAAQAAGITRMLIPGTNLDTSKAAVEIAEQQPNLYVAAGIHPHHAFELYAKLGQDERSMDTVLGEEMKLIEPLYTHPKVVAVGEVGLDRHMYVKTKYEEYVVTEEFVTVQKHLLKLHITLALLHDKPLILHNREAADDLLTVLNEVWDDRLNGRMVFHCCEANDALLDFAIRHHIYIGVDGDITYGTDKHGFISKVPHDLLVIETDSPYLLPEPLRTQKLYPNTPANLPLVAQTVASLWKKPANEVAKITETNGVKLFRLS